MAFAFDMDTLLQKQWDAKLDENYEAKKSAGKAVVRDFIGGIWESSADRVDRMDARLAKARADGASPERIRYYETVLNNLTSDTKV